MCVVSITPASKPVRMRRVRKLNYFPASKPVLTDQQADDALYALLHGFSVDFDDPDFGSVLEGWVKEQERKAA